MSSALLSLLLNAAPGDRNPTLWFLALGSDQVNVEGPVCRTADAAPALYCGHDSCYDVVLEGAVTEFRRLEAVLSCQ